MNNIVRNVIRSPVLKALSASRTNTFSGTRDFTRTLWHMSKLPEKPLMSMHNTSFGCNCGCGSKFIHTKGERELVEFLNEEIATEKQAQKSKTLPTELDGFKVKLDGSNVELTKTTDKEKIVISFNINHTVDTEGEEELGNQAEENQEEGGDMKSKPNFEVDITKGDRTLSFSCSFLKGPPVEGEYDDVFGIEELSIFQGELTDKTYACAGDVLDGYLYDLLMNVLEEKGISNEFVTKLGDLSTAYEHTSYIGLLESLSSFTVGK